MLYGLNSSQSYAAADIVCVMQLFIGRVAMLGFAAELIGEELTGETPFSSMSNISDVVTAVLLMFRQCCCTVLLCIQLALGHSSG